MASDSGSPWAIPYPDLADAPDGPGAMSDVATTLATSLARAYPCTSSTHPSHTAGLMIYETDTDMLKVSDGAAWQLVFYDSGTITDGFSDLTGWTNTGCFYRLVGPWAFVHIQSQRTGSDLGFLSSGGLTDEHVVTVPSAVLNSDFSYRSGSGTYSTGGTFGFAFRLNNGTGNFTIISGMPSTNIHSGDTVYADFFMRPA